MMQAVVVQPVVLVISPVRHWRHWPLILDDEQTVHKTYVARKSARKLERAWILDGGWRMEDGAGANCLLFAHATLTSPFARTTKHNGPRS